MEDFLTSVSPFLNFIIKANAISIVVGIISVFAMLLLALVCCIAEWRKKHDKR